MIFVEAYKIILLRGTTHACNLIGIYKGYDFGTQKVTFIWVQVANCRFVGKYAVFQSKHTWRQALQ